MTPTVTRITADGIYKQFHVRRVLKGISFTVKTGQSVVITGPNGSGKSTLIKILSGLLRPSRGTVQYFNGNTPRQPMEMLQAIGLVSPYLQLYPDLTAREHLEFFGNMRGMHRPLQKGLQFMEQFGLKGREADLIKTYSSGMLQRMKYVLALLHQPDVLFVDEPSANLDEEGKKTVYDVIRAYKDNQLTQPVTVFLGKWLFNVILLLALEIVIVPLFVIFLDVGGINWGTFIPVIILGSIALSTISTIIAAIIAQTSNRGALFAVLTFPLAVPVLRSAIQGSWTALEGGGLTACISDLQILFSFSVVIFTASILLFDFIWRR